MRGRVRRHAPEQRDLITLNAEIRETLLDVSEHHRQITNHPVGS